MNVVQHVNIFGYFSVIADERLGYDEAHVMRGKFDGCAAIIRELCPEVIYILCANHNLNLAIVHA